MTRIFFTHASSVLLIVAMCGCVSDTDSAALESPEAKRNSNSIVNANLVSPREVPAPLVRNMDDSLSVPAYDFGNAPAELEPNDAKETATPLSASTDYAATGSMQARTVDVFTFSAEGAPQLWYIEVTGESVRDMSLSNPGVTLGRGIRSSTYDGSLVIPNVFLTAGEYYITLLGTADELNYTIRVVPLGPPDMNMEREPNDDASRAHKLEFGKTRTGYLPHQREMDVYKFTLSGEAYVRFNILSPSGSLNKISLMETARGYRFINSDVPDSLVYEILLPSGHYVLKYWNSRNPSKQSYSLRMEKLNPHLLPPDVEPNTQFDARPLPKDHIVYGTAGDVGGDDWYRLPALTRASEINISGLTPGPGRDVRRAIQFFEVGGKNAAGAVTWNNEDSTYVGTLPEGSWDMRVRMTSDYRFRVRIASVSPMDESASDDVSISIQSEASAVAAYWNEGQRMNVPVVVTNNGASAKVIDVSMESDNYLWKFREGSTSVTLDPGQSTRIDAEVEVNADAWDDQDVQLVATASSAGSLDASSVLSVSAECGINPLNPFFAWELPGQLLGGMNVSEMRLGGSGGETAAANILFDGMSSSRSRFKQKAPFSIATDLAGDKPHKILGMTIHPQASGGSILRPRPFEFHVSSGGDYQKVYDGLLRPDRYEQAFVLATPVQATGAKLFFPAVVGAERQEIYMSEWKVIADPSTDLQSGAYNIADPTLGGHVIWANPFSRTTNLLIAEKSTGSMRLDAAEPTEWVIGFHNERAAQIQQIEMDVYPESAGQVMTRFNVSVSTDNPTGPWVSLGQWVIEAGEGGSHTWELDKPVWARYVRFSNSEVEELGRWHLPRRVKIFEKSVDEGYSSILGEWGHYSKNGPFEAQHEQSVSISNQVDAGDTRSEARRIETDELYTDNVSIKKDVDWYEVRVPSGSNRLRLDVKGDPTFRGRVIAEDKGGTSVTLERSDASTPQHVILEAEVESGTYYVRVEEPPRSVAFLWDNSGSVGTYTPTIYQTMSMFGSGVIEGIEFANWLPFGSPKFLLEEWSDQPYVLQQALSDYKRDHSSSNSEDALLVAMREMEGREGTKAIVMLTDALTFSTDKNSELWKRFERDRPRVFTLELHSAQAGAQDLMQSWANVDAGFYDYFETNASLEVGFKRASCHIRRPAQYSLRVTTRNEAPPADGTLFVDLADTPFNAVEIILDASGSMLQRIDGKRRIAIAREVLADLVDNTLPENTPVALRVFGHRTPGECQTDLEVALAPMDRESLKQRIQETDAKNLAKTPIGASLAHVASDLAKAEGQKLVLLITDGEETCGGDPAAAIEALKEGGLDVRVNIVGFAIDDEQLKSEFSRWATAGGGRYFDAATQQDLAQSVEQALLPKFQVFNSVAAIVAEGTVRTDSMTLSPGTYSVKVLTTPAVTFDKIEIKSEQTTTINVGVSSQ